MSTTHIMTNVGEVETHIGSRSGVGMGGKGKQPHPGELWLLKGEEVNSARLRIRYHVRI